MDRAIQHSSFRRECVRGACLASALACAIWAEVSYSIPATRRCFLDRWHGPAGDQGVYHLDGTSFELLPGRVSEDRLEVDVSRGVARMKRATAGVSDQAVASSRKLPLPGFVAVGWYGGRAAAAHFRDAADAPLYAHDEWWIVSVNLWGMAALFGLYPAIGFARWLVRRSRPRKGACRGCGYDLRGLSTRRCPECGTQFT